MTTVPPFHEELRAASADAWEAMQSHPFVLDVIADRLPQKAFVRYLSFEWDFVEAATLILGHALIRAPDFTARRALIGALHGLAEAQVPFFQSCFRKMGVTPVPPAAFPAKVTAFRGGMLAMAEESSYAEILCVMLAAEWMYATWCGRAAAVSIANPELRRWVAMHAAPDFVAGVDWLRAQVDALFAAAPADQRARGCERFRRVLELEIGFHEAAYG